MIDINLLRNNIDEVESRLNSRGLRLIKKVLSNLKTKEEICKLRSRSFKNQGMTFLKK